MAGTAGRTETHAHEVQGQDRARARVGAWQAPAGYPAIGGHRSPRFTVCLDPPEEAAALLHRAAADLRALRQQIEEDHAAALARIQAGYATGDMTPNQRTEAQATATHERAERLARVEGQMADLQPAATIERARRAAQDASAATWRAALANGTSSAHNGNRPAAHNGRR